MATTGASSLLLGRAQAPKAEPPLLPSVEEFFRLLGFKLRSRLVNRCSTNFQVQLEGVNQTALLALKSDPDHTETSVYCLLRFDKAKLPGLMILERDLLVRVIGAMLGDDKPDDVEPTSPDAVGKALSPVQVRIAARVVRDMLQDLRLSWQAGTPPSIEVEGVPGHSRVVSADNADEDLVLATFDVSTAEGNFGKILVAVPAALLRGTAGVRATLERKRPAPDIGRVMPVELDLVAEMARLTMRVRDLKQLQVGDLIPLGRLDTATLRVNGKAVWLGEPGHSNGQRCIRVKKRPE